MFGGEANREHGGIALHVVSSPLSPPRLSSPPTVWRFFRLPCSRSRCPQGAFASGAAIWRVLLGAAVITGFGWWARSKATDKKSNSCKMTFSRPAYVPLPVEGYPSKAGGGAAPDDASGYGYRLIRYMDRKLPAGERVDPRKPGGVPVLFVPGHLGSYEQVGTETGPWGAARRAMCDDCHWCKKRCRLSLASAAPHCSELAA